MMAFAVKSCHLPQAANEPLDEEVSTEDMLWNLVLQCSIHQHRCLVVVRIYGDPHCIEDDHEKSHVMEERTSCNRLRQSVLPTDG